MVNNNTQLLDSCLESIQKNICIFNSIIKGELYENEHKPLYQTSKSMIDNLYISFNNISTLYEKSNLHITDLLSKMVLSIQPNIDELNDIIKNISTDIKQDTIEKDDAKISVPTLHSFNCKMDSITKYISQDYNECQMTIIKEITTLKQSLNDEIKKINDTIHNLTDEYENYKQNYDTISKSIDTFVTQNHKEPQLSFNGNHKLFKFDINLVKKYPGSYFYELLKKPDSWMNNGDIHIDHDSDSFEYIDKYMRDDKTLINDLKDINIYKRFKLIEDLEFYKLPLKSCYYDALFHNNTEIPFEAWHNRVLYCLDLDMKNVANFMKKNGTFDKQFYSDYHVYPCKYGNGTFYVYVKIAISNPFKLDEFINTGKIPQSDKTYTLFGETHSFFGDKTWSDFKRDLKVIGYELDEFKEKELIQSFPPKVLYGSLIIESDDYDRGLRKMFHSKYEFKLLYTASQHDFSSETFHKYCDNKGPTLVLIKSTDGWIFGGYTNQSWKLVHKNKLSNKKKSQAFLFTLKNPFFSYPRAYNSYSNCVTKVYSQPNNGPVFGCFNKIDLFICDHCNQSNQSYINTNGSNVYYCDPPYKSSVFTNTNSAEEKNYFTVEEYEVYSVINTTKIDEDIFDKMAL